MDVYEFVNCKKLTLFNNIYGNYSLKNYLTIQ